MFYGTTVYWNYYDYRTNNHIEGWHTTLKKMVGKAHPNFEISEVMKNQQESSEMKLEQLELGGRAPSRKKK